MRTKRKELRLVSALGIDWSPLIRKTSIGTLLTDLTMSPLRLDFDRWSWEERTGNQMIQITHGDRPRYIPWEKILLELKTSADQVDEGFWSALEKDLKEWHKDSANKAFGTGVALDPVFAKTAKANMHALLEQSENELNIDALAMAYAMHTKAPLGKDSLEAIRSQIRAYIATDEAFSISKGGMAKVYRLQTAKGKATDVLLPSSEDEVGGGILRWTQKVRDIGMSKEQFLQAKRAGMNTNVNSLRAWMAKNA